MPERPASGMVRMFLYYNSGGILIIRPQDNPHRIVDAILATDYNEDFCISADFDPDFIARLMKAGFLVMSSRLAVPESGSPHPDDAPSVDGALSLDSGFVLLPKLHLVRSALFFDRMHVKKSVRRFLGRYELRADADFDRIVDRCLEVHGDGWLTPPLVSAIRDIRRNKFHGVYPMSFGLYRDGKLVAGEFGIKAGGVYTSYSGYYDESNCGTVQMILTTRYLRENGFAFFDLGMPLDYKTDLGAVNIGPHEFVEIFRTAASYS